MNATHWLGASQAPRWARSQEHRFTIGRGPADMGLVVNAAAHRGDARLKPDRSVSTASSRRLTIYRSGLLEVLDGRPGALEGLQAIVEAGNLDAESALEVHWRAAWSKLGSRSPREQRTILERALDGQSVLAASLLSAAPTESPSSAAPIKSSAPRHREAAELRDKVRRLNEAAARPLQSIAMFAHELRTPLTAVREVVEILSDGSAGRLEPVQHEFIEVACRNAFRLGRTIEDILESAQFDKNAQLRPAERDLGAALEQAARRAEGEPHSDLRIRWEKSIEPLPVSIDGAFFERAMQRLLSLCRRSARSCELAVLARRREKLGWITVVPGEPGGHFDDALEEVNNPPGAGLGLAVRIIEAQGGRVGLEGQGSARTLYVALPLRPIEGMGGS